MRVFLISICVGLFSLNAYSQSKLAGAGKTTKVGGSAAPKASSSNSKKPSPRIPSGNRNANAKYASTGYMEITGVSFANTDTEGNIIDDYGANLYASEVKYLKPKVFYRGLASEEKEITVDVKIIKEDGSLESGSGSTNGYTYSNTCVIEPGSGKSLSLSGWGRNSGGSYASGQYKFEIWYKGNILFQKGVRLYSGETPLATSKIFKITGVSFSNQTANGDVIDDFGSVLYEGNLQYITPKIYYTGLYSNAQDITLYYKIFYPSGTMMSGKSSPLCYTAKDDATIKPGSNSLVISGYGSSSTTVYQEGVHKVQYWIDGEKIYETSFTVKKKEGVATYLTVDSKTAVSTSFSSTGGTETFYVKTDAGSWQTWGVPSWCEITNKSATSFTIKCQPNSGARRTDYMKIKAGGKEVRIDISQN